MTTSNKRIGRGMKKIGRPAHLFPNNSSSGKDASSDDIEVRDDSKNADLERSPSPIIEASAHCQFCNGNHLRGVSCFHKSSSGKDSERKLRESKVFSSTRFSSSFALKESPQTEDSKKDGKAVGSIVYWFGDEVMWKGEKHGIVIHSQERKNQSKIWIFLNPDNEPSRITYPDMIVQVSKKELELLE